MRNKRGKVHAATKTAKANLSKYEEMKTKKCRSSNCKACPPKPVDPAGGDNKK